MAISHDGGSAADPGAALPDASEAETGLSALLAGPAGGTGADAGAAASTWQPSPPVRAWRAFRTWRRNRPFWGGLLLLAGSTEIFLSGLAPLHVIIHLGLQGLAGQAVPVVMFVCGALLIFNPAQRVFYAIVGMLLTAATWVTSNLGGFIVGLVLGLIGCSLAFAWSPERDPEAEADESA